MNAPATSSRFRLLRTWGLAGLILLVAVLWMLSGLLSGESATEAANQNAADEADAAQLFTVLAERHQAQAITSAVEFSGDTAPDQTLNIAAQVEGQIIAIGARQGARVERGQLLARIDKRDLGARRERAAALVHQRKLEHVAAKPLAEEGVITLADLANAAANLEGARAELANIDLQLANLEIRAPANAILEQQMVEVGDYVKIGNPVAVLLVNDPLVVTGGANEQDIEKISVGSPATATLSDGRQLQGQVRFVSARASDQTRTFTVEVEVENPQAQIPAGLSAKVTIPVKQIRAYRLASSLLALADDGSLGVKSVAEDGTVIFHEAQIVKADGDAVWLGGLPEQLTIITRGQGFVQPGEKVKVELAGEQSS